MRSQQEIKEKIYQIANEINGNPKHPLVYQYKILVYKLYWDSAKQFLKVEDQSDERKEQWKKLSSLDYVTLREEIIEQLDIACMHVQGNALIESMICCLILLCQFWLLGSKKDKVLKIFWEEIMNPKVVGLYYEPIFIAMCNELQVDWNKFKLRYPKKEESAILDANGNPILSEGIIDEKNNN